MQLEMLGWNGFFASQQYAGVPGRVASSIRERLVLWTEAGEVEAEMAAPSGNRVPYGPPSAIGLHYDPTPPSSTTFSNAELSCPANSPASPSGADPRRQHRRPVYRQRP